MIRLEIGNCLDVLRTLADNSVDSIVTDPPYGLTANKKGGSGVASVNLDNPYGRARISTGNGAGGFMGHKWDSDVPSVEIWVECLRVLKPGGYLLAFAGTRTQHRMACRIEDAGFEIRDMIAWVYGSGFPKSHNGEWGGTALKPALEPITMARKPLAGTVEANWRQHGTGALNIDGCRVLVEGEQRAPITGKGGMPARHDVDAPREAGVVVQPHALGRWPANLIHDGSDEVLAAFPQAKGQQGPISGTAPSDKTSNVYGRMKREGEASADSANDGAVGFKMKPGMRRLDEGSASRFFYCSKASKRDRDEGLGHFPTVTADPYGQHRGRRMEDNDTRIDGKPAATGKNNHPTVKPTDLMAYLCRLVTPSGGVVLDPFMGSGSTGKAAVREGFHFIGIELEAEYFEIAKARISAGALPLFMEAV